MRVAVATYGRAPDLPPDERLLIPALAAVDIAAIPVVWDEPAVDWAAFDAVVIRSCWDYHLRVHAFLDWVARLERLGVRVLNAPALLRWNADKRYLLDVARRGIAIVPTRLVPRGSADSLGAVLDDLGAAEAVVKPAVSASAHGAWRTSRARAPADAERYGTLVAAGDVLVQPFLEAVVRDGEWSVVCFAGEPSHAVLKRPAPGDWRVQGELGGTAARRAAPGALLSAVRRILRAAGAGAAAYARVDGCLIDDAFVLMELELIEPQLYLDAAPAAPDRFARAIAGSLGRIGGADRAG